VASTFCGAVKNPGPKSLCGRVLCLFRAKGLGFADSSAVKNSARASARFHASQMHRAKICCPSCAALCTVELEVKYRLAVSICVHTTLPHIGDTAEHTLSVRAYCATWAFSPHIHAHAPQPAVLVKLVTLPLCHSKFYTATCCALVAVFLRASRRCV